MPITELPAVDGRTVFVRALIEAIKDSPSGQQPYREAHDTQVAEVQAKAARRERMIAISRKKKGMKFPGSRPWQKAGFRSRQEWLDHLDAQPQLEQVRQTANLDTEE